MSGLEKKRADNFRPVLIFEQPSRAAVARRRDQHKLKGRLAERVGLEALFHHLRERRLTAVRHPKDQACILRGLRGRVLLRPVIAVGRTTAALRNEKMPKVAFGVGRDCRTLAAPQLEYMLNNTTVVLGIRWTRRCSQKIRRSRQKSTPPLILKKWQLLLGYLVI